MTLRSSKSVYRGRQEANMIIIAGKDGYRPAPLEARGGICLFKSFVSPVTLKMTDARSGRATIRTIDVWGVLKLSIDYINNTVKFCRSCNEYFQSLPRGRTLREIIDSEKQVLHLLAPKRGYTEN